MPSDQKQVYAHLMAFLCEDGMSNINAHGVDPGGDDGSVRSLIRTFHSKAKEMTVPDASG